MSSTFYRAVFGRIFATTAALVAGVGAMKLYSWYLSPAVFGAVVVALQLMEYLPLVDGGFRTTVNRRILAEESRHDQLRLIRFCQVLYSLLGGAVAIVALAVMLGYSLTPTAAATEEGVVFFAALGLVGAFSVISTVQINLLIGLGAQPVLFILFGIKSLATVITLWMALAWGAGVWAFPISSFFGALVSYLPGLVVVRSLEPSIRFFSFGIDRNFWRCFHQLKGEAWGCFRSQVSTLLLFSADLVLVGFLSGASAAGSYGILVRIFKIVRSFIQSSGEAAWPIVARHGLAATDFSRVLLRGNAWVYGSMTGVAVITFSPFLQWFMGSEWMASRFVIGLVAARFLITGMASTVTYLLYGLGEFRFICRHLERELVVAGALAFLLGWPFGVADIGAGSLLSGLPPPIQTFILCDNVAGVCTGFLLSTLLGTAWPIIHGYAKRVGLAPGSILWQMWWRALSGMGVSFASGVWLIQYVSGGPAIIVVGVIAFSLAMALAVAVAVARYGLIRAKRWDFETLYACLKRL